MIYLWFTCDLPMIYLWFTYDIHPACVYHVPKWVASGAVWRSAELFRPVFCQFSPQNCTKALCFGMEIWFWEFTFLNRQTITALPCVLWIVIAQATLSGTWLLEYLMADIPNGKSSCNTPRPPQTPAHKPCPQSPQLSNFRGKLPPSNQT